MKVSIINNQPIYGIDYSDRDDCTEVFDIADEDFHKIESKTHTLEQETNIKTKGKTRKSVEIPVVEEVLSIDKIEDANNLSEDNKETSTIE